MPTIERRGTLPEWGIEPVPPDHRVLTAFDQAVLWGDLGIGLLVIVTGALLVPGLGFWPAMAAIVLGSVIGSALLGLGAVAGADHGIPTMVLFRPILGVRGSWLPSWLNALQLVGWTAVELWAMSFVADVVSRRAFGFSARWLWLAIASVTCTALALWGPVGVTRIWMKRFGFWVIVAISIAATVLVLNTDGIGRALSAPGAGGWPTFGVGLDLVIALPVSWLPLVADYSRFSSRARGAFVGTFGGYAIANIWLYALGALLVLGSGATPDPAGVAIGVLAIAGGTFAGVIFIVGLLVGEADNAFADIYSSAISLQNVWPRLSHSGVVIAIAAISTALAGVLTMSLYENFLFFLGSIFLPLFGVLAADYFLRLRRRLHVEDLYRSSSRYSGTRPSALIPWGIGFLVYHWILPTGPDWWIDPITSILGTPLSERFGWLSASIPSFGVAFLLALMMPALSSEQSSENGNDLVKGER